MYFNLRKEAGYKWMNTTENMHQTDIKDVH